MEIVTVETPSLGDRSYLLVDGDAALVVDPQRDVDRVLAVVEERGLRITHVAETHIHNDYLTGGLELVRLTGAAYHVSADEDVAYDRVPTRDGDTFTVGATTVRVLHTPGHTPTHLSYVAEGADGTTVAFTGGSLLFGSVGRTDLISPALTEQLTRAQFASARRLAELPDATQVLPTHGFGSFCSSGDTAGATSATIGDEKQRNQALTIDDEDAFVAALIAGLDAYPAYYAHMGPGNLRGPAPVDLSAPEPVDVTELKRRIHAGEWVVDLRARRVFAQHHLDGTINVELADSSSTYLGWIIPWGTPLTLIGGSTDEVAAMQRQLVRIGIDRLEGRHESDLADLDAGDARSYEVVDFAGLRAAVDAGDTFVVDSRRDSEWAAGHIDGAHHVPLHAILDRIDEIPDDRTVLVHCAGGFRASIAASLLDRAGKRPVLVDGAFAEEAPEHFELVTGA